jgi:hypothetical protein
MTSSMLGVSAQLGLHRRAVETYLLRADGKAVCR